MFIACCITIRLKMRIVRKRKGCTSSCRSYSYGRDNCFHFKCRGHTTLCIEASCNRRTFRWCSIPFWPISCNYHVRLYSFPCLCILRMIWHNRCSCIRDFSYIHPSFSIRCSRLHDRRIHSRILRRQLGNFSASNSDWLGTRHFRPK